MPASHRTNKLLGWIETCIFDANKTSRHLQIAREQLFALRPVEGRPSWAFDRINARLALQLQKSDELQSELTHLYAIAESDEL